MKNWLNSLLSGDIFKKAEADDSTYSDRAIAKLSANPFIKKAMDDLKVEESIVKEASVTALIEPARKKTVEALSDSNLAHMLTELTLREKGENVQLGYSDKYSEMAEMVKKNRKKAEDALLKMIPSHTLAKKADLTQFWTVTESGGSKSIVRLFDTTDVADAAKTATTLLDGVKAIHVGDEVTNVTSKLVPAGSRGVVKKIDPAAGAGLAVFCEFPTHGGYWVSHEEIDRLGWTASASLKTVAMDEVSTALDEAVCSGAKYDEARESLAKAYEGFELKQEDYDEAVGRNKAKENEKAFTGTPMGKGDDIKQQVPAPYRSADEQNYTPNTKDFGTGPIETRPVTPVHRSQAALGKLDKTAEEDEDSPLCDNCGHPVGADVELECDGCGQEICDDCIGNHNMAGGRCPASGDVDSSWADKCEECGHPKEGHSKTYGCTAKINDDECPCRVGVESLGMSSGEVKCSVCGAAAEATTMADGLCERCVQDRFMGQKSKRSSLIAEASEATAPSTDNQAQSQVELDRPAESAPSGPAKMSVRKRMRMLRKRLEELENADEISSCVQAINALEDRLEREEKKRTERREKKASISKADVDPLEVEAESLCVSAQKILKANYIKEIAKQAAEAAKTAAQSVQYVSPEGAVVKAEDLGVKLDDASKAPDSVKHKDGKEYKKQVVTTASVDRLAGLKDDVNRVINEKAPHLKNEIDWDMLGNLRIHDDNQGVELQNILNESGFNASYDLREGVMVFEADAADLPSEMPEPLTAAKSENRGSL